MALRNLPPRLQQLPSVLGYEAGDERAADKRRRATQHWRAWYDTARWRRLARAVFARDGYRCQQTGAALVHRAPHPLSPVAHHKRPHRGDARLFWDPTNIETVSKGWHDGPGQAAERRRGGG